VPVIGASSNPYIAISDVPLRSGSTSARSADHKPKWKGWCLLKSNRHKNGKATSSHFANLCIVNSVHFVHLHASQSSEWASTDSTLFDAPLRMFLNNHYVYCYQINSIFKPISGK
jgi:hypothetical protein